MKNIFKKIIVSIITLEAKLVLWKYKPKIIAVTGSVGKTTTKDAIYTVLSEFFYVRKSEKSFNSDIGVPLSILGCDNGRLNPFVWFKNIFEGLLLILFKNHYPKWLVLEVGADSPGDIENIAKWIKPDIAVFTRFAKVPVHIEFFESPKVVMEEKKKLAKYLKKDGILILNGDDKDIAEMKEQYKMQTFTFGFEDRNDVMGSNGEIFYEEKDGIQKPGGIAMKIDYRGVSVPVKIHGVLGVQHMNPALAAIAVGVSQNVNLVSMSQVLSEKYESQPGRMKILNGIKNTVIIDDSYNSSPLAVEKALETLDELVSLGGRKIAVLGDMMELGKYSIEEHKKAGKQAAKVCDILVTVGLRSRHTVEGALNGGMNDGQIQQFEDSRKAGLFLQNFIQEKDIILVKGSRWATRMERTVEEIMAEPEKKGELLVG